LADLVTTQILENGPSRLVMKFTNLSDGTGESGVVKVDATSTAIGNSVQGNLVAPGTHLSVNGIFYDITAMRLRILWDADTDVDLFVLSGDGQRWQFRDERAGFAIHNPLATGATGSILFTTVGAALNSAYTVILSMMKGVPQT
jgi:hypothetical protein